MKAFSGGLAVKDLVWSLLWPEFHPWLGSFCMLQVQQNTHTQKKEKLILNNRNDNMMIGFAPCP